MRSATKEGIKMVTDQESEVFPKKISRVSHGIISGFILFISSSGSSWIINNYIEPHDNVFINGFGPILIIIVTISSSIWVANIILKRVGYLPIKFWGDDRRINGESVAGCIISYVTIGFLLFVILTIFSFMQAGIFN